MSDAPMNAPADDQSSRAVLSIWDAISIIIGIVVGVAIFRLPSMIFGLTSSPLAGLGIWVLAGVLCLIGALCYSQLVRLHPGAGGDYVYLTRTYGPSFGFLFGWAQLTGVFSGSIGAMAWVFADYASRAFGTGPSWGSWFAVGAVVVLTTAHIIGVRTGKTLQNILTVAKLVGLMVIVAVGLASGPSLEQAEPNETDWSNFGLAMVFALYAFGGWNDSVFVAAEVKDSERNMPRALAGAVAMIIVIYLLVNLAYLSMGVEALRQSKAPAADLIAGSNILSTGVSRWGARVISVLVMISALGAIHGLLFTGSRLYAALGADHPLFAKLGRWDPRTGTPVWALLVQCGLALVLILAVGTRRGRDTFDTIVSQFSGTTLPWERFEGEEAELLVAATAPVFWSFFMLTGASLILIRRRQHSGWKFVRHLPMPMVFLLTCAWMLYSSIDYAKTLVLLAVFPLVIGVPLYFVSTGLKK